MQQPYQRSYCVYREGEATQALDPVEDRLVSTGSHHLSLDALHTHGQFNLAVEAIKGTGWLSKNCNENTRMHTLR